MKEMFNEPALYPDAEIKHVKSKHVMRANGFILTAKLPSSDDAEAVFFEVLSEVKKFPLSPELSALVVREVGRRLAKKMELSLELAPQ
ncbi:hypothetical protein [Serratia sp. UGAL515B_01]|uniref:hypothetical protein n=1 Tax=Serratia sp. UGAL515B_01 TaxID=2986763 RepID=UPI002954B96A|nr:hypothetical protein [Serratia sp. UGAL515B_01]WON78553.1 hypothetical protein OK023_07955 [Serratia sp. UGAL515B_01]